MLARWRKVMQPPFARQPGRRSLWVLFSPEMCALAVYLSLPFLYAPWWETQSVLRLFQPGEAGHRFSLWEYCFWHSPETAIRALKITGPLMILMAVWRMASSLARERERGTLEALLLTTDHERGLAARFLRGLWPLARLALWLLPIYLPTALSNYVGWRFSFGAGGWSIRHLDAMTFSLPSLGVSGAMWWTGAGCGSAYAFDTNGCVFAGLRWANDVSAMLLAAAVTWWFSARSRTTARAAIWGLLATGALLLTILSPDLWWLLLHMALPVAEGPKGLPVAYDSPCIDTYWAVTGAVAVLRLGLCGLLVARTVRKFDHIAIALDDRPAG